MKAKPPLPGVAGRAAAWMYTRAIAWRNHRFDARKGVVEFDRPCISVGNLSTGGTGKTPVVKWVISRLHQLGHDPCIAMRGYKSVGGISDEAQEYVERYPELPLVVRADRARGLIEMFATERGERVDSIVLDDGFQHRQIARQCDIVVIDATRSPFDDDLLPAGHLREPVENLRRADVCILARTDFVSASSVSELAGRIAAITSCPVAFTRHAWTRLRVHENGATVDAAVTDLRGKRVVACCGIGNPEVFFEQVRRAGAEVVQTLALPDHAPFTRSTMAQLMVMAKGSDGVILTEKDWMKARTWASLLEGCCVFIPIAEIEFVEGEAAAWGRICQVFERDAIDEGC